MTTIVTPRPPLNLFEAVRLEVDDTWTEIYEVPKYEIPALGPTPSRTIDIAAILTGLLITNTDSAPIQVSIRIVGTDSNNYLVLNQASVPANDFMLLSLDRQVMATDEKLEIKCEDDQTATIHFSFILNTKEEYEVIT
jgi:hypothetical protein